MINAKDYGTIVFFTGAGMSAESGVPTYRGKGGIWHEYDWVEYACQKAFDENPEKVLKFHEKRRKAVLDCLPHEGHAVISGLEAGHPSVSVVTQNIDGMHQRSGSLNVLELHGSLWRLLCPNHGVFEDFGEEYSRLTCETCDEWLRPDIVWFGDALSKDTLRSVIATLCSCDLFVSVGTSGVVYPAAIFPRVAKDNGARCIEINPEATELSDLFDEALREPAGKVLPKLFQ